MLALKAVIRVLRHFRSEMIGAVAAFLVSYYFDLEALGAVLLTVYFTFQSPFIKRYRVERLRLEAEEKARPNAVISQPQHKEGRTLYADRRRRATTAMLRWAGQVITRSSGHAGSRVPGLEGTPTSKTSRWIFPTFSRNFLRIALAVTVILIAFVLYLMLHYFPHKM